MSRLLLNEVYSLLSGDSTISDLAQDVARRRNPDEPKELSAPQVSIHRAGGPKRDGAEGVSKRAEIEIKIWGYEDGSGMTDEVDRIAGRIDEVLIGQTLELSNGSRASRFHNMTGWDDADQPDPNTIHAVAQFECNYWSQGRIGALTS